MDMQQRPSLLSNFFLNFWRDRKKCTLIGVNVVTILFCLCCSSITRQANGGEALPFSLDSQSVGANNGKEGPVISRDTGAALPPKGSLCAPVSREATSGLITSPNFPHQFPVPIYCRWVLEAPPGKVIALYFTQYFLRDGFRAAEYAFYLDASLNAGRRDLGLINAEDEVTSLLTTNPILVLEFEVSDSTNIHMRVLDYFLDVFGFNITYEFLQKEEGKQLKPRPDACSAFRCSFTGNCYVDRNFETYFCSCFPGFFGKDCEFGPACNPFQGINDCKNGGSCRYIVGSSVDTCTCPSNYEGKDCERVKLNMIPNDCNVESGLCSVPCLGSEENRAASFKCICPEGYSLAGVDSRSCIPLGKMRYIVSIKVYDSNVDMKHLDKARFLELKSGLELAVLSALKPFLQTGHSNLRLLDFKPGAVVELHFFHNEEDEELIRARFQEKLRSGRLGRYAVEKSFLELQKEPGLPLESLCPLNTICLQRVAMLVIISLNILSIEASEEMPVLAGSELSIACMVVGSNSIEVSWYKEGALINFNGSYERSIWKTVLPKNTQGLFTAILNIEKVDPLDSGFFTCQVKDWGFALNKSFQVIVTSVSKPTIIPFTKTVIQRDVVVITCYSKEDSMTRKFGYNWLKNGEILNPSREKEVVEDLFPTGSRIIIKSAQRTATYTCLVTTPSGTSFVESVVTVIPTKNSSNALPTCSSEEYEGIDWPATAANAEDLQRCSQGYRGEVRRRCLLKDGEEADWEEPDFSRCYTQQFLEMREKFRSLRLGYEITSTSSVLDELKAYLNLHKPRRSEGEPVVEFLRNAFLYLQSIQSDKRHVNMSGDLALDILSLLLDYPGSINRPSVLSLLHHLIVEFSILSSSNRHDLLFTQIRRKNFFAEIIKIEAQDELLRLPLARSHAQIKKRKTKADALQMEELNQLPSWLTDSVQLNVTSWSPFSQISQAALSPNASHPNPTPDPNPHHLYPPNVIIAVFYRNLAIFMPKHFLMRRDVSDIEYQIHSRLVTVALLHNNTKNLGHRSNLKITAHLKPHNVTNSTPLSTWNITCGLAELSDRIGFHTQHCQTQPSSISSVIDAVTVCICDLTGTYAVILTSEVKALDKRESLVTDFVAIFGSGVCILLVSLTLVVLLIQTRCMCSAIACLKMQVCVAIIGTHLSFIATLYPIVPQILNHHLFSLIMFFQLVAFSLQLCFCATVYAQVAKGSNSTLIQNPESKIAFLGWAIPVSVEGASLAAQALEGFPSSQWSFKLGTRYFYCTVITSSLLTLCQFFLYTNVRLEFIRRYRTESLNKMGRLRTGSDALNQSLAIILCLNIVLISTLLYANLEHELCRHAFAAASCFLGVVTLFCYACCSHREAGGGHEATPQTLNLNVHVKSEQVYAMNSLNPANDLREEPILIRTRLRANHALVVG